MKKFLFKTIVLMVAITLQVGVNAQNVRGVEPQFVTPAEAPAEVSKVQKQNDRAVVITYETNDQTVFVRERTKDISLQTKKEYRSGETQVYLTPHHDFQGDYRHGLYVVLEAGADWLHKEHQFNPIGTLAIGYETCHFGFEVQGGASMAPYPEGAMSDENYFTYSAYVAGMWKVAQGALKNSSSLAIGGAWGYTHCRSDIKGAEVRSWNMGASGKLFLRGNISLGKVAAVVEVGGILQPYVSHLKNDHQNWHNIGPYAQMGIKVPIKTKF